MCQDTKVLTPEKVSVFICHGPPCELLLAIIYHSPLCPLGQWRIDTWSVWVVDPWKHNATEICSKAYFTGNFRRKACLFSVCLWLSHSSLWKDSCGLHICKKEQTTETTYVKRHIEGPSRNHRCCKKAINITYAECVCVALVIPLPKHMRRIILSPVVSLVPSYFPIVSHNARFSKKKLLDTKCVF